MKKLIIIFIFLFNISIFTQSNQNLTKIKEGKSIPAKLVKKIYDIYKYQKYNEGLKISTGLILRRFQRINDYLRMNQNKIPNDLNQLSNKMSGYYYIGESSYTHNNIEYTMVDCVWVMRYRDTSPQSTGIIHSKLVVRSFLVKKINNEWKVSSDKFITEYILRGEEFKLMEKIKEQIEKQRKNQERKRR